MMMMKLHYHLPMSVMDSSNRTNEACLLQVHDQADTVVVVGVDFDEQKWNVVMVRLLR